jgi:hypothetical protein
MFIHDPRVLSVDNVFDFRNDDGSSALPQIVGRLIDYFHRMRTEYGDLNAAVGHDMWSVLS